MIRANVKIMVKKVKSRSDVGAPAIWLFLAFFDILNHINATTFVCRNK